MISSHITLNFNVLSLSTALGMISHSIYQLQWLSLLTYLSWHTSVDISFNLYQCITQLISVDISHSTSLSLLSSLSMILLDISCLNYISLSLLITWLTSLSPFSYCSHTSFLCILLSPYFLIVYLFLCSPLTLTRPLVVISSVIPIHWDNPPITR
jgi:hypothetical protein